MSPVSHSCLTAISCRRIRIFAGAALCVLAITVFFSCSSREERVFRKTQPLMDTIVAITVVSDSAQKAEEAIDKAFAKISLLDKMLTIYADDSEISALNRNSGGKPLRVSAETIKILEMAISIGEKTDAAFDVTIGPVMALWDFKEKKIPSDKAIGDKLSLINYRGIMIDRKSSSARLTKKGAALDLGGVAKGYAADAAIEELKKSGITAALVAVAGDIRGYGVKPDGIPWRIGIRNPRQKDQQDEIIATIELKDRAVSTSGDYERYFEAGGRRYHHIIDPKTGNPARGCRSVTVFAPSAVETDAFSTAVFVLGPAKGMQVLREMGFEGFIVDSSGEIHITPGLQETIEIKGNSTQHNNRR